MGLFAVLAFASCLTAGFAPDHVRFIVTGDDRWNSKAPRPGTDDNGVNVGGLKRLLAAALSEKPDAILINGDLIGGAKTDEGEASQLQTWLKVMRPAYDGGVKVLTVRGNHEVHCPDADAVWRKAMSGRYANPGNGPAGEKGLTYTFKLKNCLFIALDQFEGEEVGINQGWLDRVLTAPHPIHVFAFAHKMAFFSGHHTDGMTTVPAARDAMINSLVGAGARMVFFGHDHLYDDLTARLPSWPEGQSIHQIVCGTAGAPFVKGKPLTTDDGAWKLTRVAHVEQRLGYCVVDVKGAHVSFTFKAETSPGHFEPADSFAYSLTPRVVDTGAGGR
ncbi:MAG: metallophosphoesterase family protein [Fimbriimonadaceae bacterium]